LKLAPDQVKQLQDAALRDMERAKEADYLLPVFVDLVAVMCIIGAMQLAARHPENNGPNRSVNAEVIRQMIACMRRDGYGAAAMLAELGDDPEYDV
jgi:hypothetical protein